MLLVQAVFRAAIRACWSEGSSIEARIAMIAITTRSSIKVNRFFLILISFPDL